MKNSLLRLTVIVCSIITLNSCKSWSGISDDGDVICSNYSYDKISVLSTDLVKDMINEYKNNQLEIINETRRAPMLNNGRGTPRGPRPNANITSASDARAISFPLEQIKEFMYHIESLVKINDSLIKSSDLGVRIYYATYPDNSTWNGYRGELEGFLDTPITMDYQYQHTIIFIPTILVEGVITDFDPRNKDTYYVTDGNFEALFNGPDISAMMMQVGVSPSGSGNVSAQNHGGLFPPRNGGTAF